MATDMERATDVGIDGYVTKPFRIAQLLSVIEGYLESHSPRRAPARNTERGRRHRLVLARELPIRIDDRRRHREPTSDRPPEPVKETPTSDPHESRSRVSVEVKTTA